jgi:hypothetical protein
MALAVTEKYEEMVLEISTDSGSTWTRICGMIGVEVTRTSNIDTAEVPDCADESLPLSVERQVRSIEVSASGTGVWAQSSHEQLMDWFYSAATLDCRLGHLKADTGDTEYETGKAILASLSNSRTKGQKVSAAIEIQFDGTPTRTAKA